MSDLLILIPKYGSSAIAFAPLPPSCEYIPPVRHSGTTGQAEVSGNHEVTIPETVSGGCVATDDDIFGLFANA